MYNILDEFYNIRGDEYGRHYLSSVIDILTSEKIPVNKYNDWFNIHKHQIGRKYKPSTRLAYQAVAYQYLRYVYTLSELKRKRREPIMPKRNTKRTKIYNTFYEFIQSNK